VKNIPNFIRADAQHLPFRDKVFDIAYSSHVIEHVANPLQMLRELIRVATRKVIVVCPHALGHEKKKVLHKNHFRPRWFHSVARLLQVACHIEYTRWRHLPHLFVPIVRWPLEITVTLTLGIYLPKASQDVLDTLYHSIFRGMAPTFLDGFYRP